MLKNLLKNVKKADKISIFSIDLEMEKIRDMYMSYDGGKLTSTIVNLDMCDFLKGNRDRFGIFIFDKFLLFYVAILQN